MESISPRTVRFRTDRVVWIIARNHCRHGRLRDVCAPAYAAGRANMQENAIKVLVVDDDEDIRETMAAFLGDLGYGVSCAATGEEAIRLIEADAAVTLLLTDIQMPGALDGWALAH